MGGKEEEERNAWFSGNGKVGMVQWYTIVWKICGVKIFIHPIVYEN